MLLKENKNKKWDKRYFCLKEGTLFYYKSSLISEAALKAANLVDPNLGGCAHRHAVKRRRQ